MVLLSRFISRAIAFTLLAAALFISGLLGIEQAQANDAESFTFDLSGKQETIGDLKPTFIVYQDKALPDVSIEYVMKRYIKLFESTDAPDVKVDALNRINNLSAIYGVSGKKLTIDKLAQSEAVLQSYDSIVDSGVFYERMDELLYQTAKASAFVGSSEESIKRLKLLVGLYPNSALADESVFRIAEAYFDLGDYGKAADQYKKLLAFSDDETFFERARFKLAWSEYRQDQYQSTVENAFRVLKSYPQIIGKTDFLGAPENKQDLIEDTLRLLALSFAKQDPIASLEQAQKVEKTRDYAYLLYDALFRFYLRKERYEASAKVASAYATRYNDRFEAYVMAERAIKSYEKAQFDIQTWLAKETFVADFGVNSTFWQARSDAEKATLEPLLSNYGEELAHLYYTRMQRAKGKNPAEHQKFGRRAASYYQELAQLRPEHKLNGEFIFLAGEARRDIGQSLQAITLYERSAYQYADHQGSDHQYRERAAYAAIVGFDLMTQAGLSAEMLTRKRSNIRRFISTFSSSETTPVLQASLATTLFSEGAFQQAWELSNAAYQHPKVSAQDKYDASLVSANSAYELKDYRQAERFYRAALVQLDSTSKLSAKKHPLGMTPTDQAAMSKDLIESLASTLYRQAEGLILSEERARAFLRVVDDTPTSSIVPQALYDASAEFLKGELWDQAIASLNHFQQAYPENPLNVDTDDKLIFAYTQNGDLVAAAQKLVSLVKPDTNTDIALARFRQAAEFYRTSGLDNEANSLYVRIVEQYPSAFDINVEAYDSIIQYYARYDSNIAKDWQQRFISYELDNRNLRTDRSAQMAAEFVYTHALTSVSSYNRAKLTLPLKASLSNKKQLLQKAVSDLERVAEYQVDTLQSAATHQIAGIYRQLATDLMASERPDNLTELQLEQYDILLEEQAYPFEEQAIEVYEINAEKTASNQYDESIRASFEALVKLKPTTYKRETKAPGYADTIF